MAEVRSAALVVIPGSVQEKRGDLAVVPSLDVLGPEWISWLDRAHDLPRAELGRTNLRIVDGRLHEGEILNGRFYRCDLVDEIRAHHPLATWRAGLLHGYSVAVAVGADGALLGLVAGSVEESTAKTSEAGDASEVPRPLQPAP